VSVDKAASPERLTVLEVLDYLKRGTAAAGLLFVVAYALGMIALSTFFGRYGLQVSDLLKVRYVCLGLSGVVMLIPVAVFFWWAGKWAPGAKKWRILKKLHAGAVMVLVCTGIVSVCWLVWLSFLTGFGTKLPASHWIGFAAWGLAIGVTSLSMLFEFAGPGWPGRVNLCAMVLVTGLGVAVGLAEYVPYLPPWAGGLAMGHVQVITHDPDLERILTGRVVVAESTPERYVFWVQGEGSDRLIEVPSSLIVAVIGERTAQTSEDGRE
jgi:hypothetical protein